MRMIAATISAGTQSQPTLRHAKSELFAFSIRLRLLRRNPKHVAADGVSRVVMRFRKVEQGNVDLGIFFAQVNRARRIGREQRIDVENRDKMEPLPFVGGNQMRAPPREWPEGKFRVNIDTAFLRYHRRKREHF